MRAPAAFARGSLMAWRGENCVGCVFSEIWRATPARCRAQARWPRHPRAHDPVHGTELYISSMTLAPACAAGPGCAGLLGCLAHVAQAFPR